MGRPGERRIAPGESHDYELELATGQYWQATFRSDDTELSALLAGPDGAKLAEGGATLRDGELVLSQVTAAAGVYRITASLRAGAAAGKYRITLGELRPARPEDEPRVAAQRALAASLPRRRASTWPSTCKRFSVWRAKPETGASKSVRYPSRRSRLREGQAHRGALLG